MLVARAQQPFSHSLSFPFRAPSSPRNRHIAAVARNRHSSFLANHSRSTPPVAITDTQLCFRTSRPFSSHGPLWTAASFFLPLVTSTVEWVTPSSSSFPHLASSSPSPSFSASASAASSSQPNPPSPSSPSFTISTSVTFHSEIKRSRFVAIAAPVGSAEEAMRFIEEVRDASASHNCWAYKVTPAYRFNDDGEPGGTAGRPILAAIEGAGVDGVVVVVTRYYGGVKLGTGGLVRAYGGAAAGALREATLVPIQRKVPLRIIAPVHHVGLLYTVLQRPEYAIERQLESYSENEDGTGTSIEMNILVLVDQKLDLQKTLLDTLRGEVQTLDVD